MSFISKVLQFIVFSFTLHLPLYEYVRNIMDMISFFICYILYAYIIENEKINKKPHIRISLQVYSAIGSYLLITFDSICWKNKLSSAIIVN